MGEYYGLVAVVAVAMLLSSVQCDVSCKGADGHPGQNGNQGRDGWPGPKGEKGEPAVVDVQPLDASVLLNLKGDRGSQGSQGPMGPKGYRGDLGAAGPPGPRGQPGPAGKSVGHSNNSPQQVKSAFSVVRTATDYPGNNQVLTYQNSVLITPPEIFNLATGHFYCRVAGVYYFTFLSAAKASMCLRIASDALGSEKLGFCNSVTNRNYDQVLSGGLVLQLTRGQEVWLESFQDHQTPTERNDNREKEIRFSGFLLFSN